MPVALLVAEGGGVVLGGFAVLGFGANGSNTSLGSIVLASTGARGGAGAGFSISADFKITSIRPPAAGSVRICGAYPGNLSSTATPGAKLAMRTGVFPDATPLMRTSAPGGVE